MDVVSYVRSGFADVKYSSLAALSQSSPVDLRCTDQRPASSMSIGIFVHGTKNTPAFDDILA